MRRAAAAIDSIWQRNHRRRNYSHRCGGDCVLLLDQRAIFAKEGYRDTRSPVPDVCVCVRARARVYM